MWEKEGNIPYILQNSQDRLTQKQIMKYLKSSV
jgi:hypothetical protein